MLMMTFKQPFFFVKDSLHCYSIGTTHTLTARQAACVLCRLINVQNKHWGYCQFLKSAPVIAKAFTSCQLVVALNLHRIATSTEFFRTDSIYARKCVACALCLYYRAYRNRQICELFQNKIDKHHGAWGEGECVCRRVITLLFSQILAIYDFLLSQLFTVADPEFAHLIYFSV